MLQSIITERCVNTLMVPLSVLTEGRIALAEIVEFDLISFDFFVDEVREIVDLGDSGVKLFLIVFG